MLLTVEKETQYLADHGENRKQSRPNFYLRIAQTYLDQPLYSTATQKIALILFLVYDRFMSSLIVPVLRWCLPLSQKQLIEIKELKIIGNPSSSM